MLFQISLNFILDCNDPMFTSTTLPSPMPFTRGLGDEVSVTCAVGSHFAQEQHEGEMQVNIRCTSTGWNVTQIPNCERKFDVK